MTYNSSSRRMTAKVISIIFVLSTFSLFIRSTHLTVDEQKRYDNLIDDENSPPKNIEPIELESVWTYRCKENVGCVRELLREENKTNVENPVELEVCWLNCGQNGSLWPYPTKETKLSKCLVSFLLQNIEFRKPIELSNETVQFLQEMQEVFKENLRKLIPSSVNNADRHKIKFKNTNNTVLINILVSNSDLHINLDTSEAYVLKILSGNENEETCLTDALTKVEVTVEADTVFGARHALETLSQLMAYDRAQNCFQMVSNASIEDGPEFPYRGVLLDTARNFIPIPDLKRLIDGMSYNKMNIFHWHLSDTNSFPFYSKRVPQMTQYGAYSQDEIYFPEDVKDLVHYARIRGIKILPELDAPAHAGNGWQWGPSAGLGELVLCINQEPWRRYCGQPPCGQLNPSNVNVYTILGKIYQDMLEVFDNDIFHMGGDEVYSACWKSEPSIVEWVSKNNKFDTNSVWGFFQKQAYSALKEASKNKTIRPILWTSGLTQSPFGRKFLNSSNYIIQVWEPGNSPQISQLLKEGYQLIISNVDAMYLDHGAGTWLGKEHIYEYKLWQVNYDNRMSKFHPQLEQDKKLRPSKRQILGGEATLWTEKVNFHNMDAKIWPRSAALAESLWSDPQTRPTLVYSRLNFHNRRMIQLGIHADQLQPESCLKLTGHCDDPLNHI